MNTFRVSPSEIVKSCYRNRQLITSLIKREITGRYQGSMFGVAWTFLTPLLLLGVYSFVFGTIFKGRWSTSDASHSSFTLILFAGLIIFNIFAECASSAPTLVSSKVNYVKKIIFPLEVLPFIRLSAALFQGMASFVVWLLLFAALNGPPPATALLTPLIILPLSLYILGASWLLSSLGVFLRDLQHAIGLLVSVTLFLSAVFYPITVIPERVRWIMLLNPVAATIDMFREIVFFGHQPNWILLAFHTGFGLVVASLGFAWFQKTRKGFADVV